MACAATLGHPVHIARRSGPSCTRSQRPDVPPQKPGPRAVRERRPRQRRHDRRAHPRHRARAWGHVHGLPGPLAGRAARWRARAERSRRAAPPRGGAPRGPHGPARPARGAEGDPHRRGHRVDDVPREGHDLPLVRAPHWQVRRPPGGRRARQRLRGQGPGHRRVLGSRARRLDRDCHQQGGLSGRPRRVARQRPAHLGHGRCRRRDRARPRHRRPAVRRRGPRDGRRGHLQGRAARRAAARARGGRVHVHGPCRRPRPGAICGPPGEPTRRHGQGRPDAAGSRAHGRPDRRVCALRGAARCLGCVDLDAAAAHGGPDARRRGR